MERQGLALLAVGVVVMALLHEAMQLKEIGGAMHSQFFEGAEDYYSVLGLRESCTQQEIDTAYKRATSKFNSRNRDEDERRRRAKIVTAYETLSKVEARKSYDKRRMLVYYLSAAVHWLLLSIPILGLIFVSWTFLRQVAGRIVPALGFGGSFEQNLRKIIKPVEWSLEITVHRTESSEKLGMDLNPPISLADGAIGIKIGGIASDGVVDKHNQAEKARHSGQDSVSQNLLWWSHQELQVDDIITAVNGHTTFDQIRQELQSSSTLCFCVRRSLQNLLPWVTEIELKRDLPTERWGCQLTPPTDRSDSLEVSSDEFTGALKRWNDTNPSFRVRKGDRIVAVDRHLKVGRFTKRMQDKTALSNNWLIVRGVSVMNSSPQEVTSGPFEKRCQTDKLGIKIGLALDNPVRGHIIESDAPPGLTVVKEVHANYLVDEWNQRGRRSRVDEGAIVVSVNGKRDPKDFTSELKKHKVLLCLRSQRGVLSCQEIGRQTSEVDFIAETSNSVTNSSCSQTKSVAELANPAPAVTDQARLLPLRLDLEQPIPFMLRLIARFFPSLLGARSFEVRLRCCLTGLRCEFDLEIDRAEGDKLGLNLHVAHDAVGGFHISEVGSESLISKHNLGLTGRSPKVQSGDRLVMLNNHSVIRDIQKELENKEITKLCLRFSRSAADAAPGLWEADVERTTNESSWGMQLKEQTRTNGGSGSGVLRIDNIAPGSAVDRWNKSGGSVDSKWIVEPGDLIVGVSSEVGYGSTLAKLKESQRVRLTILRWHARAALQASGESWSFEVNLSKISKDDKLGIRLDPSDSDPTRTVVAEVLPGGLVDRHNKSIHGSNDTKRRLRDVRKGDEVESINGQSDQSQFAKCCQADHIVLRVVRHGVKAPDDDETVASETGQAREIQGPMSSVESKPQLENGKESLSTRKPDASASMAPPSTIAQVSNTSKVFEPGEGNENGAPRKSDVSVGTAPPSTLAQTSNNPRVPEPLPAAKVSSELRESPNAPTSLEGVALKTSPSPNGAADGNSHVPAKTAQENFLLKAEVEQLKRQLFSHNGLKEERDTLLIECEKIKAENVALRVEAERIERQRKDVASASKLRDALSVAEAELACLREERAAERRRLEEVLHQNEELASANSRLLNESDKLKSAPTLGNTVPCPERMPLHLATIQGLDCIGEGMVRLQELSASLEHVLS